MFYLRKLNQLQMLSPSNIPCFAVDTILTASSVDLIPLSPRILKVLLQQNV